MLFVSLLIATAIAFYLWLRQHYSYWEKRNVPHEKPIFFLGNMKGLGSLYHWREINERVYRKFKNITPVAGFYTFTTRAAFVMDLDLIKDIMIKEFNSFTDRNLFHNERDDPLTANLAFLDGEKWHGLRQKISPVFTTGKMKFMFPTVVAVGQSLEPACFKIMQEYQDIVDVKELCARYTTDVIGSCAFGIECNSLEDPQAEFRKMGRSIFEKPRHSAIVQGFMFTNPQLARRFRMKNFRDEVSEFFMNAVKQTVDYRLRNKIKRNDFMDMMIEMKVKRDELLAQGKHVDENDMTSGLTLEQVAAQAMVFFLAGFDTSSTTMAFCLYELALNHKIQDKLREEIHDVLQKNYNELTYDCIKDMKYLDMVVSETLRKYSITPHLVRTCVKDYRVPNTDIVFEKGLRVILPLNSIHRDPEYYPNPEKFDPERFSPEEVKARHPFAYLPFGDGPRNCIGLRFGKLQAHVGLISLLRKFRFDRCAQTQVPMQFSKLNFLLGPEDGVYLKMDKL